MIRNQGTGYTSVCIFYSISKILSPALLSAYLKEFDYCITPAGRMSVIFNAPSISYVKYICGNPLGLKLDIVYFPTILSRSMKFLWDVCIYIFIKNWKRLSRDHNIEHTTKHVLSVSYPVWDGRDGVSRKYPIVSKFLVYIWCKEGGGEDTAAWDSGLWKGYGRRDVEILGTSLHEKIRDAREQPMRSGRFWPLPPPPSPTTIC